MDNDTLLLENEALRVGFDPRTGALCELVDKASGWEVLGRGQLGLSFRLLVPLGDRRNNVVVGEQQPAPGVTTSLDGRRVSFTWQGMTSEHGGHHDITVVETVTLQGNQVRFAFQLTNRSDVVVENVYGPYLGDLQPPDRDQPFRAFSYSYGSARQHDLWPRFDNMPGYFGVDYPTQLTEGPWYGPPTSPFILLASRHQGLYAGVGEPSSEPLSWQRELRPGYDDSIDRHVPAGGEVAGHPVAIRFAAVHLPFLEPGEQRALTPIVLQPYHGGWQAGADIYKAWRDSWMTPAPAPTWVTEPHAWQQLQINSPESELRIPFDQLVEVGRECAERGVRAIQLVGWNDGGQDQNNPSHDAEGRLGGPDVLRQAIADIQALGVKVVLFAKFTWADRATSRFRNELIKQAIKDPYGDYYQHGGYRYETMTQLLDINTKRLIPMCFLSESYLQTCVEEFRKVLDLGADGILFDECLHHGPALLCFDPEHGHRRGAPVYANDRELIHRFAQLTTGNPDFVYAGEACYDWEFESYQLSYHRSEDVGHIPLMRYLRPHSEIMTAVTGFDDRSMVNQCLLYRYVISYEPYNFKGRLVDMEPTVAYGRQMDGLRTELRQWFWDGEYRDQLGVTVTAWDDPQQAFGSYSVFQGTNGTLGVVAVNYDREEQVRLRADVEGYRYRLVDDPTWREVSDGIVLPPRSAAVAVPGV